MSVFKVASRYAKSLLDLCKDKSLVEEVNNDMGLIDSACEQNRELVLVLRSPIIKQDKKFKIVEAIFGNKVNKFTRLFLKLTISKGRADVLHEITREFHKQYLEFKGIQKAKVITTFKLDDTLRNEFNKIVKALTNKNPDLSQEVSKDIIGGYILNIDDRRIDSSLKSMLKKIEHDLIK